MKLRISRWVLACSTLLLAPSVSRGEARTILALSASSRLPVATDRTSEPLAAARMPRRVLKIRSGLVRLPSGEVFEARARYRVRHHRIQSAGVAAFINSSVWDLRGEAGEIVGMLVLSGRRIERPLVGRISLLSDGYDLVRRGGRMSAKVVRARQLPGCTVSPASESHRMRGILPQPPPSHSDGATRVAVGILYSPQSLPVIGGSEAIQAHAATLIDTLNASWERSGIDARATVAFAAITGTNESGNLSRDLDRVAAVGDGYFDDVHPLRDQYIADLVALIVSHDDGDACGIAYLLRPQVNPGDAAYGFSVSAANCLSTATFEHEIGHNMGSHHDAANASGEPAFPFSYGWRFTGSDGVLYRTIMSYLPGDRVPYFSSPLLSYAGVPLGDAASSDNARSHRETAPFVAAFRSPPPTPTPLPTATPTPTEGEMAILPMSIDSLRLRVGSRGRCVASGLVRNGRGESIPNLETWVSKPSNLLRRVGPVRYTNGSGKFKIQTNLKRRGKASVYFPRSDRVAGPIRCR